MIAGCFALFCGGLPEDHEHLHFPPNPNRAGNVPVTIETGGKSVTVNVDEKEKTGVASPGTFPLGKGRSVGITISNKDTDGHVVADGVQLRRK